ncbi:N-6 DNA methylase [Helicobacter apodemus]|uniref:N-6 DNA methylase n=1 Tax=Helicobacter apodemus TaxID=135569 RepID=UPI001EF22351|nr:N-6 DNA methylase [Helicobacter apodemus]
MPTLSNNAKILDFACGAGHFLTEFIAHNQNAKLYGIEKNKDLSKVAKTACIFHNPESKSQIIFQDALDFIKENYKDEFENESFDLILSNPPYSVKGFLSNLDKALNAFSLSQSIDSKSYDKNNAIECFFVERAKQFLKEGGYFALILPVSILQKGGIYEKTRELLLAHFKLLCLVELNSRTFGSTGTQTIILFAKRVKKYDEDLISRLKDSNFSDEALSDDINDENFLKNYCEFMGYEYESFKKFMCEGVLSENLKDSNAFKEYLADYESSKPKVFKKQKLSENDKKALFEKSKFFQNNLDSKTYKKQYGEFLKSDAYNKAEENLRFQNFLNQVKDLECEKMLYFAYIKDEKVLILKSPSDKNKEGKSNKANIVKFLGYDWSNRKGDEGIKYITNKPIDFELKESDEDSDEEKKQKEVLRNINSVKFIQTPLYNPSDKEDNTKLAYALKSFMEQDSNNALSLDNLLESLQSSEQDIYTLFSAQCKELLDFSRAEFSKAISLNPKNLTIFSNPFENSQFKLVKLGEILKSLGKGKRPASFESKNGVINFYKSSLEVYKCNTYDFNTEALIIGDGGSANIHYENGKFSSSDHTYIFTNLKEDVFLRYVYFIIRNNLELLEAGFKGIALKNIAKEFIENGVKIPLPPLEIQKQIVNECEKVEEQYNTIRMSIEEYQKLIKAILVKCGICEADTAQSANSAGEGGIMPLLAA